MGIVACPPIPVVQPSSKTFSSAMRAHHAPVQSPILIKSCHQGQRLPYQPSTKGSQSGRRWRPDCEIAIP
jgi:hypothetical protein